MNTKSLLVFSVLAVALTASADVMDRPQGFKIGDRMTLRPYVSLSYTYDSNIDSSKHTKGGSQWMVSPGADLDYRDDNWSLVGSVYYQYHAYNNYSSQLNQSSYGESLTFNWTDAMPGEKGWTLTLAERFRQISQDDDMSNSDGRGIGRDRKEFTADGVVQRCLNAYWHAALLGSYYYLEYDNNVDKYAPLYGWKRATVGGDFGYAPTKWTDFLVHASHQWYWQDNNRDIGNPAARRVSGDSRGWSVMAGMGSHATEKITYRFLGGWSRFEYGDGENSSDGFTYQASANWKFSSTLNFMLLGSSYYQPSEQHYGSATKVNTISVGLGKSLVRGKLNTTMDLAFRNESTDYMLDQGGSAGDENIWTARLGLNYTLNRFFSVFGRVEYQMQDASGNGSDGHYNDYDRWRGTVGLTLTY